MGRFALRPGALRPARTVALLAAVALPALAALPALPACAAAQGAPGAPPIAAADVSPIILGESFTVRSEVLHETRRINVYAPAGYTASTTMRLPVLYMPDGGMQEDFQHVAGLLQVLVGNGTMRPFLLVGIENTERRRDLTGPTSREEDRKIAPRVGGSEPFRRFIRDELKPRVTARYRTTGETGIVGESLAGLFIVETLLREPSLFDHYIALDPSLWWNGDDLIAHARELLAQHPPTGKTLFLANSSEPGIAPGTRRFAEILRDARLPGFSVTHLEFPDETHATIYHPAAMRAFRLLFAPSPAK